MNDLHTSHPGVVRMKRLARRYVWWPKIDQEIENMISSCNGCHNKRAEPPTSSVHPWEYPERPWQRIHADFAGPISGQMYLLIVDSYSK